jgi:hypothetical protein
MLVKDWKAIAEASGIRIPEIERAGAALNGLEAAFRPLARSIPYDVEPAITFRAAPEEPR